MRWVFVVTLLGLGCSRTHGDKPRGELDLGPAASPSAHRIVTLAPSLTEIFVAIGAADRIVGVTRFDDAPEVASAARVGGYSDPDVEAVLHTKPDLIVCQPSPGNRGAVESLARGGIPVVTLPESTLADVDAAILRIGQLTGRIAAAEQQARLIRDARADARTAAQHRARHLRVAVLLAIDPLIGAGPGSFIHEILEDAGAEDAVEKSAEPYPRISLETFLRRKPDALLLALMAGDPLLGSAHPIPSVDVPTVSLHSAGFTHPGPKVVEALHELTTDLDRLATTGSPARGSGE